MSDAEEAEQHHRAGREQRRRSGNHVAEVRHAGVLWVKFALEFGVSIIVQAHAGDAEDDERSHEDLNRPDRPRAGRRRVPQQHREGRGQGDHWNPLRRRIDVPEQNQLARGPKNAEPSEIRRNRADKRERCGLPWRRRDHLGSSHYRNWLSRDRIRHPRLRGWLTRTLDRWPTPTRA